jgi:hypothetical protein
LRALLSTLIPPASEPVPYADWSEISYLLLPPAMKPVIILSDYHHFPFFDCQATLQRHNNIHESLQQ